MNPVARLRLTAPDFLCSRKREARKAKERAAYAQEVSGLRAKLFHAQRHKEKIELKKTYVEWMPLGISRAHKEPKSWIGKKALLNSLLTPFVVLNCGIIV